MFSFGISQIRRPSFRCTHCIALTSVSAGVRGLWNKLSTGARALWNKLDLDKSKLDLAEKEFGYCALIGLCVCSLVVALGELREAKIKEESTMGLEKVPAGIRAFIAFSIIAFVLAIFQALTPILSWRR